MFQPTDEISTRRAFVAGAAKSLLGLGSLPLIGDLVSAADLGRAGQRRVASAKSVIYVYLNGGMSHLDTFDTKPGAATQGPVESLPTSADGVLVSQHFPQLAKQMKHVAVINSMTSTQGAHAQGQYYMHTSYFLRGTLRHPDLGAWSARHLSKRNPTLPANVKIGGESSGLGGGFLESKYAALPIGDPAAGLQYSRLPNHIDNDRFVSRLSKLKRMNKQFSKSYDTKQARAYPAMYDEAVRLMRSKDLDAFDLSLESEGKRERYGENSLGQGCLLAKRLIENGVRFVEVKDGGWDTHDDNFSRVAAKSATLDQALAALLDDLASSHLLDETLVVVATEFGRTPTIQTDRNNGRNHYPQAFTCLMAGGGIQGGIKYGRTDEEGREVIEDQVDVPDFNATIAYALGIPLDKKVMSPELRPFTVADQGEPITGLFTG